ncbi:hypothetical protein T12_12722 [Trichinella patagoniensis]|uniref:Uncharacterized protein n=1 Tax=Trichinella patagoniensis TaxID=990121 RepID=A0A0V1ACJ7_9BILA|nr:hypothetical protein T12_12722 [Trichinella patagoniensis]
MGKLLYPQNGVLNGHQSSKFDLGDTRVHDLQFVSACGFQPRMNFSFARVTADLVFTSMLHHTPPTEPSTVGVSISGDRMTMTGKVQSVLLTLDVRSSRGKLGSLY